MRWLVVFACAAACESATEAPATLPPTTVVTPAPAPGPAPRRTFELVAKADRPAAAAVIAKTFPAAWNAQVEVDAVGMPRQVILELPDEVAPADRVTRALAVVREHGATFGVLGALELHHEIDTNMIRIGAGDHWSGQVVATFAGRKLTLFNHLWPIGTERVELRPDVEKLVEPYYGIKGEFRSRCKKDCKDDDFVIDKRSFSFVAQMALLCTPEGLVAQPAVAILRHYRSGSRVPGVGKLPAYVDPKTHEPIVAPHIFMPGDGSHAGGVTKHGFRNGDDYTGCWR